MSTFHSKWLEAKSSDTPKEATRKTRKSLPEAQPTATTVSMQTDIPNDARVQDLPIGNKNESTAATVADLDDHRVLAVAFLEAVEGLLTVVKDERPLNMRTPHLKQALKRAEGTLDKLRRSYCRTIR